DCTSSRTARRSSIPVSSDCGRLSQFVKERLRLQQVRRPKSLREPTVDRRKHIQRHLTFTLLRATASFGDAGAQFKRLCPLIGGNVDGMFESGVSFSSSFLGRVEQQQFGML